MELQIGDTLIEAVSLRWGDTTERIVKRHEIEKVTKTQATSNHGVKFKRELALPNHYRTMVMAYSIGEKAHGARTYYLENATSIAYFAQLKLKSLEEHNALVEKVKAIDFSKLSDVKLRTILKEVEG